MRPGAKAALLLAVTFLLGGAIGALGAGFVRQHRMAQGEPPGRGDFVAVMEHLIQPRDSAQATLLRPVLRAADRRNQVIVDDARGALRRALDSLRVELVPLLDSAQLRRLDEFAALGAADSRAPAGLGGDGPGRPPPRARPPGPRGTAPER